VGMTEFRRSAALIAVLDELEEMETRREEPADEPESDEVEE
jgi:hypothetical protein